MNQILNRLTRRVERWHSARQWAHRMNEIEAWMRRIPIPQGGATDTPRGKVRLFDDFLRKVIDTTHLYSANADTGDTQFEVNEQHNGAIRGGVAGTDGNIANVFGPPMWKAEAGGPLLLEVRAALIAALDDGETYLGFTDDDGADEMPLSVSVADALIAAASTAAGFAYTGGGTPDWKAVSVNSDSDGVVARCNTAGETTPKLGVWQTFRIVITDDGHADFFINGIFHHREDNAVPPTTLLGFGAAIQSGGTARSLDIDYVFVEAGRV